MRKPHLVVLAVLFWSGCSGQGQIDAQQRSAAALDRDPVAPPDGGDGGPTCGLPPQLVGAWKWTSSGYCVDGNRPGEVTAAGFRLAIWSSFRETSLAIWDDGSVCQGQLPPFPVWSAGPALRATFSLHANPDCTYKLLDASGVAQGVLSNTGVAVQTTVEQPTGGSALFSYLGTVAGHDGDGHPTLALSYQGPTAAGHVVLSYDGEVTPRTCSASLAGGVCVVRSDACLAGTEPVAGPVPDCDCFCSTP